MCIYTYYIVDAKNEERAMDFPETGKNGLAVGSTDIVNFLTIAATRY